MNYKGEDLDVRTLQVREPGGRERLAESGSEPHGGQWGRQPGFNGQHGKPIWADDTVVAVLNHAFDLAVAHRAGEVRTEHFFNALTLNAAAARVLDQYGIAIEALRRESAGLVAGAPPSGFTNGRGQPKVSETVEDIIHVAAERAERRRVPISVVLLLEAMNEMKQDLSGLDLLRRHAANRKLGHYAASDEGLRESPGTAHVASDTAHGSRLDALEDLVRNLSRELAAERQAYASLASERQRGATAVRRHSITTRSDDDDEAIRLVADRLAAIETGIDERFSDLARGWIDVGDRMREIERKVEYRDDGDANFSGGEVIDAKFATLDKTFSLILDRLSGLERMMDTRLASGAGDIGPVTDLIAGLESRTSETASGTRALFERISALERKIDSIASRPAVDTTGIEQRIGVAAAHVSEQSSRLESLMGNQLMPVRQALAGLEHRISGIGPGQGEAIGELHDAVVKINGNQHALASSLDQWRLDQTGDLGLISNRVQGIETETNAVRSMVETMASNIGAVYAILARREANKSKFRNWLFGTDDWYSASWDTERWREQMIAAGSFVPMPRRKARHA